MRFRGTAYLIDSLSPATRRDVSRDTPRRAWTNKQRDGNLLSSSRRSVTEVDSLSRIGSRADPGPIVIYLSLRGTLTLSTLAIGGEGRGARGN